MTGTMDGGADVMVLRVADLEAPPQALEGKLNDMVNEMWDAVERYARLLRPMS